MEIYLVGGAVRDTLLGIAVKERDWVVVGATKKDLIELGYKQVGSDFPVFLHPETKEEYALARTERKSGTGHKGFSFDTQPNVTLEEDLRRRDLTINAMAQSEDGSLIDPFNGQKDLKNKLLKQVSDAFQEDPLRVFRVARFATKLKHLGFSIDRKTMNTMNKLSLSGELETLPKERIWQETYKALQENNPTEYFRVLIESKAILGLKNIQKIDLDMFELITSKIPSPKLRWASLASNLECDLNALNKVFGVPKKIQELSCIYRKLYEFTVKQGVDVADPAILKGLKQNAANIVKNTVPNYAFVGTAVKEGLKKYHTIETFDIKEQSTCDSLHELVNTTDIVFVCVPTPMNRDGSCNTDIVKSVVREIDEISYAGLVGLNNKINCRVSSHPFVVKLFEFLDVPIISTSANISGKENIFSFKTIYNTFHDLVDIIVDNGDINKSLGSTIIEIDCDNLKAVSYTHLTLPTKA